MSNSSSLRDWVKDAATHCVPALLCEVGCARLSVDDIARRLGVAKGSLFFSQRDVASAIAETLDAWTDALTGGRRLDDPTFSEVCRALFRCVPVGDGRRPALPCCLATSPCPHGWTYRWQRIAASLGLGGSDLALTLGEAVQAIASHPDIRGLLAQGRTDEAVEVIATVVGLADDDEDYLD
jgi:AcrR family transcriptional regulator